MEAFLDKFAQNCKEHGDKTALVCGDSRLSYAELDERSGEVAFYLHQRSIGKEQFVAVHLERGTDCVAAIIGIWKAGAAFICLPETYPQERIRFICADCSVLLMQGLGMALTERFMPGRKIPVSDYIVPSFETLPDLECIIVDGITYAGGPFGAKSAGEGPTVAIGAAILEAVSRAVGESLYTLPVTPEKLMPLLVKKRKGTF